MLTNTLNMKLFTTVLLATIYSVTITAQPSIKVGNTLLTTTCNSETVLVTFTTTGSFSLGNTFKAQLINATNAIPGLGNIGGIIGLLTGGAIGGASTPIDIGTGFGFAGNGIVNGVVPKGTPAGLYFVRIISSNPSTVSDTSTTPLNITGGTTPKITLECDAQNVALVAPAAKTYLWSTGETTQKIIIPSNGTATYSVQSTDSTGCSVKADTTLTIEHSDIIHECINQDSVRLTSSVTASSYRWTLNTSNTAQGQNNLLGQLTNSLTPTPSTTKTTQSITVPVGAGKYTLVTANPSMCGGVNVTPNICAFFVMKMYPNPNKGKFTLSISTEFDKIKISVCNDAGQELFSLTDTKTDVIYKKEIDLSALPRGTYLLKVDTGEHVSTQRLIIGTE
jgi:Secretion system C-terminal sorting domain